MLDFGMQLLALTPTRPNDNTIPMPQVRRIFLVRKRRQGFNPTLSLRAVSIPVSRVGGRNYRDVLRGAGTRYYVTSGGDKNTQMSHSGSQCLSGDNQNRGDSGTNWIERERNGLTGGHVDGPGAFRASGCKERASRWVDLAVDCYGSKTFRN